MREAWSKKLTKTEDFDEPMYWLVDWRSEYDLEVQIALRVRRLDAIPPPPEDNFTTCSEETAEQAKIYSTYIEMNAWDDRPANFYPLLDRMIEWMDEDYGGKRI